VAGVIDIYLAALRRELGFDPALARRMTEEIETHLWEATEADPAWPSPEAERRAVERFGLAREIASQFAEDSVSRQSKRTWIALLATLAVTFVAMRLRVVWLGETGDAYSVLAPLIDRYAFIAALGIGTVGWLAYRRSWLPLAICLLAIVASVVAGIVRARLFAEGAPPLVLLAAAGEIALIGLLAVNMIGLGRRLRRTALLRRQ
jgi:hypothetical protein